MLHRLPLLVKIWLSTSVALTALFFVTGWLLQRQMLEGTLESLEEEAKVGFQSYESVWKARAELLGATAAIMAGLPQVRAAFGTGDQATIRDSAREVWDTVSDRLGEGSFFVVADPRGSTVAALHDSSSAGFPEAWPVVAEVLPRFPKQAAGYLAHRGSLFYLVLTPVYVDAGQGRSLIDVLVAGFPVNRLTAERLKASTGGSDFLFFTADQIMASSLNERATEALAAQLRWHQPTSQELVSDGVSEYLPMVRDLPGPVGAPAGRLAILRSFDSARERVASLRRQVVLLWFLAIVLGLGLTYLLARRIVRPIELLDRAAAEVSRQNYEHRVEVSSQDELGRLSLTFNTMCDSLREARQELIRQERISTIGRLASSIVHDLRNPLAAIYGGAEMMVDTELSAAQVKRLAANIYRASRRIQEMLQDLAEVSRGRTRPWESCRLAEIVQAAVDGQKTAAEAQQIRIEVHVPQDLELPLERARMERVLLNLIGNALEVMPDGGEIRIAARRDGEQVLLEVRDTGPGISPDVRGQLFQPFVTYGKRNGLGLGLALSRQTVLEHGGDIWAEDTDRGACFVIRLPLSRPAARDRETTSALRN